MLRFLFIIFILIGITSCSTLRNNKSEDSLPTETNFVEGIERPLCKYNEIKGISELTKVSSNSHHFIFFPGDNPFEIKNIEIAVLFNKEDIASLHARKEIKSIKRKLILGHKKCKAFEFELMLF